MKTIYSNQYIDILLDKAHHLTQHDWKMTTSRMREAEMKETLLAWRGIALKHSITRNLVNATALKFSFSPAFQDWIAQEIVLPLKQQVGFYKTATLLPAHDLFSQISVEQSMEENQNHAQVETQYFSDLHEAQSWLREN